MLFEEAFNHKDHFQISGVAYTLCFDYTEEEHFQSSVPTVQIALTTTVIPRMRFVGGLSIIAIKVTEYLNNHNAIVYYICDSNDKNIRIGRRHRDMTPQNYRFRLFSTLYHKLDNSAFYKREHIFGSNENQLCIGILGRLEHKIEIDRIMKEAFEIDHSKVSL